VQDGEYTPPWFVQQEGQWLVLDPSETESPPWIHNTRSAFSPVFFGSEPTAGQLPVAVHNTAMPIDFFSFPSEIRNKIYEEALVLSELIVLWATQCGGIYGAALPRNSWTCGPLRLCLAILLANKRVHREASTLLQKSLQTRQRFSHLISRPHRTSERQLSPPHLHRLPGLRPLPPPRKRHAQRRQHMNPRMHPR
jgi:hypothetical protein